MWIFFESGKWSKYKLLTERDTNFHNLMIVDLFNYMRVNGTFHIMYIVVINDYVGLITSWLSWRPMDMYAACAKNNK